MFGSDDVEELQRAFIMTICKLRRVTARLVSRLCNQSMIFGIDQERIFNESGEAENKMTLAENPKMPFWRAYGFAEMKRDKYRDYHAAKSLVSLHILELTDAIIIFLHQYATNIHHSCPE